MIVTCEECSTSFQLDDTRIPASGARVRCSRCKHAFFLPNPSSSKAEAVRSVVEETIHGGAARVPAPARDLGGAASGVAARGEPEEEDWQFSEEIRVADDEDEAGSRQTGSPDPSSFDLTGDFGQGFDPETLSRPTPEKPVAGSVASPAPGVISAPRPGANRPAPAPAPKRVTGKPPETKPAEPQRDESSFGSIDDFSSLIEEEGVCVELATQSTAATPRPVRSTAAASDDLGDPESWDLVGGDDARHAKSTVAALVRPPARPAKKKASPATLDLFAEGDVAPAYEELEPSTGASRQWLRVGKLVGWCITAASVTVIGGLLLRSESARWTEAQQRLELGPLVVETTRTGWLESSRAGFLLVFNGEVRNTGDRPVMPVPLQLALLDGAGERLSDPPLRIGHTLLESTLREARPEELAVKIDRAIAGWVVRPLAPGEARRFSAIVPADRLPAGARRVLLETERVAKP